MPIYEFCCKKCCSEFEELVSSSRAITRMKCPQCGSTRVEKKMSMFGMSGVEKPVTSVKGTGSGSGCTSCRTKKCGSCH